MNILEVACPLLNRLLAMKSQPKMKLSDRHPNAALLVLTPAVLILVLAGVLFAAEVDAPAPRAVGATTTLTGWFHTQFGDSPSGGGEHVHAHVLVDDNGHATQLSVPEAVVARSEERRGGQAGKERVVEAS